MFVGILLRKRSDTRKHQHTNHVRVISLLNRPICLTEEGETIGLAVNPQPGTDAEPVRAIVACATWRIPGAISVRGAGYGSHEPLLNPIITSIVAQSDLDARLVSYLLSV